MLLAVFLKSNIMELGKLKNHFEQMESGKALDYKLSKPFSWRGVYAECAFEILKESSTKEENLEQIEKALTEEFHGYKGGEFRYDLDTEVHFESSYGSWSDGGYSRSIIEEIKQEKQYDSVEEELVNLIFL
jgi:hypothetical protein